MQNDKTREALLPCPFCGSSDVTPDSHPYVRSIWCNKCETSSANFGSLEEAIKAWNTRTPQQAPEVMGDDKMIDLVREQYKAIGQINIPTREKMGLRAANRFTQAKQPTIPAELEYMSLISKIKHFIMEWKPGENLHETALAICELLQAKQQVGDGWLPIESAPKDGQRVLLKFKGNLAQFDKTNDGRLDSFSGLEWVGRHGGFGRHGDFDMGWGFAAPVGHGGFIDGWLEGWLPLPPTGASNDE